MCQQAQQPIIRKLSSVMQRGHELQADADQKQRRKKDMSHPDSHVLGRCHHYHNQLASRVGMQHGFPHEACMKAWLLSLHDRKNSKWTYACGPCRERVRRHLTLAVGHAGAAWRRVRLGACTTGHMNDGGNPGGEEEAKAQGGGGRQSGRVFCTYGEYQTSVEEHDDIDED